jgi:ribulose-phosphate 3-epimerase
MDGIVAYPISPNHPVFRLAVVHATERLVTAHGRRSGKAVWATLEQAVSAVTQNRPWIGFEPVDPPRMSSHQHLVQLRAAAPAVLPSLLMCDFGRLEEEVRRLEQAGIKALHLDVMDGHFVPNLSYGLPLVETFRRLTSLPLDVHLMISNPADYVDRYHDAGADVMTIHIEAAPDPRPLLEQIRKLGAGAGLSLNPPTPLSAIVPYLELCDVVLVMSVMPGFGGQKFDPVALEKLRALRELVGPETLLEVDGGVNEATIGACAAAGAELFVVGSAIFKSDDYAASARHLEQLVHNPHVGNY